MKKQDGVYSQLYLDPKIRSYYILNDSLELFEAWYEHAGDLKNSKLNETDKSMGIFDRRNGRMNFDKKIIH